MSKRERDKAVEAAELALVTEIQEATHLMRLTNRALAKLLQAPEELSARELTQIRKALNRSMLIAPPLLRAIQKGDAEKPRKPVVLTEEDLEGA